MFGWLKRKPTRDIFRFWDGTRERAVDPVRVLRLMREDKEFVPERHPVEAAAGEPEAVRITMAAVCRIFGVGALDDSQETITGMTEVERLNLLFSFGEYLERVKKMAVG